MPPLDMSHVWEKNKNTPETVCKNKNIYSKRQSYKKSVSGTTNLIPWLTASQGLSRNNGLILFIVLTTMVNHQKIVFFKYSTYRDKYVKERMLYNFGFII